MRINDGEGSTCPPILIVEMLETLRNLLHIEAASEAMARNALIDKMQRKQIDVEDELRIKHWCVNKQCRLQMNSYRDLNN